MDKTLKNSNIIIKKEKDNWALLFNIDNGETFCINPIGVFIWNHLDGQHSVEHICEKIMNQFKNVPENAQYYIEQFIKHAIQNNLATRRN